MNREIFEDRKELECFLNEIIPINVYGLILFDETLKKIIKNGWIKKSIVDEAEEKYYNYKLSRSDITHTSFKHELIEKQHEAIQHLKDKLYARDI